MLAPVSAIMISLEADLDARVTARPERHRYSLQPEFGRAVLLSALLLCSILGGLLAIRDDTQRLIFSDIAAPLVDFLALTFLILAARRSFARSRRLGLAWAVLAFAMLLYALGDTSWSVLEAGLGLAPFPSIADVFYLAYYIPFLVAIHLLVVRRGHLTDTLKDTLDVAVILAAAVLGFGNFLIGPIFQASEGAASLDLYILAAYPVGDLVLLGALLLILYHDPDSLPESAETGRAEVSVQPAIPVFLIGAGIFVTIVSDAIYTHQTIMGTYASGGVLDIGWSLANTLVGLGGVAQWLAMQPENPLGKYRPGAVFRARAQWVRTYLPYAWLLGAFALLIASAVNPLPMPFPAIAAGVSIVLMLVLARQFITLAENSRLALRLKSQAERLESVNRDLNLEIAERLRAQEQLAFDVLHDQMTGLANRRLFLDRLGQLVKRSKRHRQVSFAVLFLDLDQFKVVNDSLGHAVGDQLLVAVGRRLEHALRSADTVARFGGDEFAVLLDDVENVEAASLIAEKVQAAIAMPFQLGQREVHITASTGVATDLTKYEHADDLLRDVDLAMYRAKALGKARCVMFSADMRDQAFSRLSMEEGLRNALKNGEFQLFYQPITSLESDRVVALEALLRWSHPARGLLLPAEFLPIAEESELILPVGEWVLNEACRQLKAWQTQYPRWGHLTVNVNMSNREFSRRDLPERVRCALRDSGLEGSSLRLEITERVLVDSFPGANGTIRALNDMGVKVEIDDFGTGYSALAYLQQFPIDAIKIDKTFISDMRKTRKGLGLVRAIVSMARELGMETIAEGIETGEQLNELKGLLCGFGQGYLLSRPLDAAAAGEMLARQAGPPPGG